MKIWIDTEFNGFKGELISMALVDEKDNCWYEVLECKNPVPWVVEHVIPKLNKKSISMEDFQKKLGLFLSKYESIELIADWPEDIKHFCDALITGPGRCLKTSPLTLKIVTNLNATANTSSSPHNALCDAFALKKAYSKN